MSLIRPLAVQRGCQVLERAEIPAVHVCADRQRLIQVLLNLLSNAIKYNRPGGEVWVEWEPVGTGPQQRGRIGVRDTGPGIAAADVDRLFEPFERLGAEQSDEEGTGLGLALSRRLVEAMGGTLTLDTVVGEGSTFWATLQVEASPLQRLGQAEEKVLAVAPGTLPSATILYIEDNLANLTLVETILELEPEIDLIPALQGQLGVELACEHHPDLILLDLHLPDIPGAEVLRRLQDHPATRDIPVVVISADATPGSIEKLLRSGARAYLTKPLDVDQFLAAVAEALNARFRA
jgi:CheY-like chemotaxis protein